MPSSILLNKVRRKSSIMNNIKLTNMKIHKLFNLQYKEKYRSTLLSYLVGKLILERVRPTINAKRQKNQTINHQIRPQTKILQKKTKTGLKVSNSLGSRLLKIRAQIKEVRILFKGLQHQKAKETQSIEDNFEIKALQMSLNMKQITRGMPKQQLDQEGDIQQNRQNFRHQQTLNFQHCLQVEFQYCIKISLTQIEQSFYLIYKIKNKIYSVECRIIKLLINQNIEQLQYRKQRKMQKEEYSHEMIDHILRNVIGYSQLNGDLLSKYNDAFYLAYFDRLKIDQTMKKVSTHHKELEISEFVRLFLSVIAHKPDQTLYLAISLTKLFKKIQEEINNEKGVKFSNFTSFLCNKISQGDPDLVIPMKQIAMERTIPDFSKVRDIDLNPPPILNKVELQRPKITKDKTKKDKKLDEKKPVAKFIYSYSLNLIITLGRLSSSITLYDPKDLHVKHKIIPSTCKIMAKDVAILSIAFCERDQRIGCIINNIGITFWQATDNFTTQKILGANKSDWDPKLCGDKIYYLSLFNQWVTTDKDTIYFWDIKEEEVTKSIHKPLSNSINDICEINHIRCLLVSYNLSSQNTDKAKYSKIQKGDQHEDKMLVLYQDGKQKSKLMLGNPGCHSICYNPSTQLVICMGYQSNIMVYQIDKKTFDINLITQLSAHVSILTCASVIPQTSMIMTGDDIGFLKLWQLNYMRCLQSIKIAKGLTQISCNGNMLIYADSRINTIPMDTSINAINKPIKKQKDQESYGIFQFFRKQEESLWIVTRKEARQININTGRIKNILVLCNAEEDISAAAQVYNGFLIGTSRGQMSKFALDGQRKWKIMAHQGEIHAIKVDMQNHLVLTLGGDNNLYIWPQKTITEEDGPRKKISFQQKQINLVQFCPYANLLLLGSISDCKLTIWNYDNLKLAYKLVFDYPVTAFAILTDKYSFVVTTADGGVFMFSYIRKQAKLKIHLMSKININSVYLQSSSKKIPEEQNQSSDYITSYNMDRVTYINKLTQCEDNNTVLGSTPKGILYCFSPQNFTINCNYRRQYQPTPILKRPMKQSFQNQIIKNQFIRYQVSQMSIIQSPSKQLTPSLQTLWYSPIHKDTIYFLNLVSLQKKYVCTLCIDGYFKLTELKQDEGIIVCSHKMNFPLPVKWDIDVQNYCDLKNQIHQAIVVIDSIIKNYAYELTIKQQSSLNITSFMQKMITGSFTVKKSKKNAQTMSSEFTQADIKQVAQKQVTLKNLQAYKRLQMIKKQNQPNQIISKNIQPVYRYETSAIEKQSIRNFLQPNYLPKLLHKNTNQTQNGKKNKQNDLVSRLEQALVIRENKKNTQKQRQKQNKFAVSFSKSQLKLDQYSFRKNTSVLVQRNHQLIKDKSVKQILGQINTKLHLHKKGKVKMSSVSTTQAE